MRSNTKKQQLMKRLEMLEGEGDDGRSGEEVAQELAELYGELDVMDAGGDESRIASVSIHNSLPLHSPSIYDDV